MMGKMDGRINFISRVGGERGKAGKDSMQRYIISIQLDSIANCMKVFSILIVVESCVKLEFVIDL